ncbi:hypothetical protein ACIBBD_28900 [Streptomyces sp. NPDC051315]|uniref:hypothetical protein n=1 Tax=Streptomyces sp. NPDC051315 TaxID=3365650 RepID=UPI0037AD2C42
MHDAGNEASGLPWLVIRQDDNGDQYRIGRYATRAEAQRIADSLDNRGHRQLYWVEHVGSPPDIVSATNMLSVELSPLPDDHARNVRHSLGQTPQSAQHPVPPARGGPASPDDRTRRRIRRARLLFETLAQVLPADARERWCEEWMAEWVDLGEQPVRTRVAYLLRVALHSGPYFAWTLRLAARRQRAQ